MKIVIRIIIWSLISLTIQISGLFYANNYLLTSNTSIKTTKIVKNDVKKADAEINVPDSAKDVTVSFDARYLAYYDGDVLKVVNTKTGDEKTVGFSDGVQVSFYKWLPDRNRMLIAEKEVGKKGANLKLVYYDVDKEVKGKIKELDWENKNAEVQDIQASPLTNVIYVKVATSGGRSNIYRIDIMNEMKKIDTQAYMIGQIKVIPHEDKLIYEDLTYKRIYETGQDQPISINGINNPQLLGVDDNDNVYIGESQGDSITKIYYGSIKEGRNELQVINLNSPANKDGIFISSQGKIYINDNLKGIVSEVESGKQYVYHGNFVQMYNDGVASISDGKLQKTLFN